MVTVDDVRAIAATLPRSYEAVVRGCVKFRIGAIVYLALSRDQTILGFAFPKDLRDSLVESDPAKFQLPRASDLRFHWVDVRLAALDANELYALVIGAWKMCVPKKLAAAHRTDGTVTPWSPTSRRSASRPSSRRTTASSRTSRSRPKSRR